MAVESSTVAGAERIEEEYQCPSCGSGQYYSPTYRERKCTQCGHRADAERFRITPQIECPECGDNAPKTHENGLVDIFTCRGCYNQFQA
jgi:ribosomal protein L37AE/L43A